MATRVWSTQELDDAKTFELQYFLPSLPLPSLSETMQRYIRSVKPFLSLDEYERTKSVVQSYFQSPEAQRVQLALEERAASSRNWLELWWNDIYLNCREPLFPFQSYGCAPHQLPKIGSQIERAALVGWHYTSRLFPSCARINQYHCAWSSFGPCSAQPEFRGRTRILWRDTSKQRIAKKWDRD